MTEALLMVVGVLADDAPRNTGPDFGKASPLGLLVVVLLLIGTFLLVRSMNRHLKRVPKSFDGDGPQPEDQPERSRDDGPAESDDDRPGS